MSVDPKSRTRDDFFGSGLPNFNLILQEIKANLWIHDSVWGTSLLFAVPISKLEDSFEEEPDASQNLKV